MCSVTQRTTLLPSSPCTNKDWGWKDDIARWVGFNGTACFRGFNLLIKTVINEFYLDLRSEASAPGSGIFIIDKGSQP